MNDRLILFEELLRRFEALELDKKDKVYVNFTKFIEVNSVNDSIEIDTLMNALNSLLSVAEGNKN